MFVNASPTGDKNDKSVSSFPVLSACLRYSVCANYKYTHVWDNVRDNSGTGELSKPPVITVTQQGQLLNKSKGSTALTVMPSIGQ